MSKKPHYRIHYKMIFGEIRIWIFENDKVEVFKGTTGTEIETISGDEFFKRYYNV